jgi:hypothetical protein
MLAIKLGETRWWPLYAAPWLVLAALLLVARKQLVRLPLPAVLAVVCVVEVASTSVPIATYRSSPLLTEPAPAPVKLLADRLGTDWRMIADPPTIGMPMWSWALGLRDFRGLAAIPLKRYVEYPAVLNDVTLQNVRSGPSSLVDAASVRYQVVSASVTLLGKPIYADTLINVYESTTARPRARIVHGAVAARSNAAARNMLLDVTARYPEAITVERSAGGEAPHAMNATSASGDQVKWIDDGDPDHLAFDVATEAPGYLFVADTYEEGWRATVDGNPTPIYPADVTFRAIALEPGKHRVGMSYKPRWLGLSFALCALGMLLTIAVSRRSARPIS